MGRRILSVVGTRPNFMKTAPVVAEIARRGTFEHVLVHTGQHYDDRMSEIFFEQLAVGEPDIRLEVGAGSHAETTARVMERLAPVLAEQRPDLVLVPGDVNSTMAAALTAVKLDIPVGHIEAGLRSFDRTMPEEINRVVTDGVSDLLFTHSPEARGHLLREGRPDSAIHAVGNTMIDTLVAMRERIDGAQTAAGLGLLPGQYLVVTLHRPALVDGPLLLEAMDALRDIAADVPVAFPIHPRTRSMLREHGWSAGEHGLHLLDPVGYVEFLGLVAESSGVITDSGGIQEETTYLGIPCFTLRDNTERPITVDMGTNRLMGLAPQRIREVPAHLARAGDDAARVPPGWDGRAAVRLVDVLDEYLG
jgi:UDP-N-acetylglucosamine 2-epimerase (non-hydrolysing)